MQDIELVEAHKADCHWPRLYYGIVPAFAAEIDARVMVEVGVAFGYHAEDILHTLPQLRYFGVDPYLADYDPKDRFVRDLSRLLKEDDRQRAMDRLFDVVSKKLERFGERAQLLREPSRVAADRFEDGALDLVFIDGDHRFEAVAEDIASWWPKLRPGGVLCGDDYHWEGVKRAVDDFGSAQGCQVIFATKQGSKYPIWAMRKPPAAEKSQTSDSRQSNGADGSRILLVVSSGLTDFVHNTLESLKRVNVDFSLVTIAAAAGAVPELSGLQRRYGVGEVVVLDELISAGSHSDQQYADFGTEGFAQFTAKKWAAIDALFARGIKHVIYSDVDLVWRKNPLQMLIATSRQFDMALPTEGVPRFPPQFCTGFMSIGNTRFSRDLLARLMQAHRDAAVSAPKWHDQDIFNRLIVRSPDVLGNIFPLPELVFANGRGAVLMSAAPDEITRLQTVKPDPMIFHANCTVGLANKKALLRATGNWLID